MVPTMLRRCHSSVSLSLASKALKNQLSIPCPAHPFLLGNKAFSAIASSSLQQDSSSSRQLTLEELGLDSDDGDAFESFLPPRNHGVSAKEERVIIRQKYQNARSLPARVSATPAASKIEPSPEEMKQAALDAASILAGIAGVRLSSYPQKKSAPVADAAEKDAHYSHEKFVDASVVKENDTFLSTLATEEDVQEETSLETFSEDNLSSEEDELSLSATKTEGFKSIEEEESSSEADIASPLSSDVSGQDQAHVDSNVVVPASQGWSHPWPEWVEFLEKLHAEGLFEGTEEFVAEGKHLFDSYTAVRHATCEFGRERTDMFRSLTRKDLRVLANYSCPDLERKTSNASKRLRDHFDIPESDVCIKCKLKMSCPRAFLTPPTEIAVKTLDVLRIIAGFASNVTADDVAEKNECPEEVQASACNLLREILTLWDLPKCEESPVGTRKQTKKNKLKLMQSFSVPEKPGDWVCPNCDFMNFNRNRRCKECHVCRPPQEQEMLLGDWSCPKCFYMNFSRNRYCRECKTERPTKTKWAGGERLSDDESNKHANEKKYKHRENSERGARNVSRNQIGSQEDEPKIVRRKSSRAKKAIEKRAEKDYEASEEDEGSFKESAYHSAVMRPSRSEMDLSDELNQAQTHGSRKAPIKKVPNVLFNWSDDEEAEEKSSRALSKKVKSPKHKSKMARKQKTTKR